MTIERDHAWGMLRVQLCSCPMTNRHDKMEEPSAHGKTCLVREHQLRPRPISASRFKLLNSGAWYDDMTGNEYPAGAIKYNLHKLPNWPLRPLFCHFLPPIRKDSPKPSDPVDKPLGWDPEYY